MGDSDSKSGHVILDHLIRALHALGHGNGAYMTFGPNQCNEVPVKTFGKLLGKKECTSFQRTYTVRTLSGIARGHYMEKA